MELVGGSDESDDEDDWGASDFLKPAGVGETQSDDEPPEQEEEQADDEEDENSPSGFYLLSFHDGPAQFYSLTKGVLVRDYDHVYHVETPQFLNEMVYDAPLECWPTVSEISASMIVIIEVAFAESSNSTDYAWCLRVAIEGNERDDRHVYRQIPSVLTTELVSIFDADVSLTGSSLLKKKPICINGVYNAVAIDPHLNGLQPPLTKLSSLQRVGGKRKMPATAPVPTSEDNGAKKAKTTAKEPKPPKPPKEPKEPKAPRPKKPTKKELAAAAAAAAAAGVTTMEATVPTEAVTQPPPTTSTPATASTSASTAVIEVPTDTPLPGEDRVLTRKLNEKSVPSDCLVVQLAIPTWAQSWSIEATFRN